MTAKKNVWTELREQDQRSKMEYQINTRKSAHNPSDATGQRTSSDVIYVIVVVEMTKRTEDCASQAFLFSSGVGAR